MWIQTHRIWIRIRAFFTYCAYIRCNFFEKKKCEEEKNCKFSFLSKNLFIKDTGTKKRHIKKGLN